MNAEPLIRRIVKAANATKLEMIVIGNAGAALGGATVTTLDFDFYVLDNETQLPKISAFAKELGAVVIPAAPALANAIKVKNEREGIFSDIIDRPEGMAGFAAVRRRATELRTNGRPSCVYVASLRDIIASKKKTTPKKPDAAQAARTAAATQEWEETERRRIRALLKLPMLKRSNFLRVRIGHGSAL